MIPNQSPPHISGASSGIGPPFLHPQKLLLDSGKEGSNNELLDESHDIPQPDAFAEREFEISALVVPPSDGSSTLEVTNSEIIQQPVVPLVSTSDKESTPVLQYPGPVEDVSPATTSQNEVPAASTALGSSSASLYSTPKKTTTFRRLVPKSARRSPASHTRNISVSSLPPRLPEKARNEVYSFSASSILSPGAPEHTALTPPSIHKLESQPSRQSNHMPQILPPPIVNFISTSNEPPMVLHSPAPALLSKHAPYRPGFQPRGIYRPLTDDFLAIRRSIRDGEGDDGIKRVERTKLERRLEKLIALHFPYHTAEMPRGDSKKDLRPSPGVGGRENRISSSFLDFRSLRSLNIHDASDILRGIVIGSLGDPTTTDIRGWSSDLSIKKTFLLICISFLSRGATHNSLAGRCIRQQMSSLPVSGDTLAFYITQHRYRQRCFSSPFKSETPLQTLWPNNLFIAH